MSILDADDCRPITLGPHEVEDLHWVLGLLEDWLLHASDAVIDELGHFAGRDHPRGVVLHVIDTLGRYCAELRGRAEEPSR